MPSRDNNDVFGLPILAARLKPARRERVVERLDPVDEVAPFENGFVQHLDIRKPLKDFGEHCCDLAASQTFFETVFGMTMTAFGPTYACTLTGDVDIGLQADQEELLKHRSR
jgi:hypothetical protein